MTGLCDKNIVGVLVGKVLQTSHPLCIRLYDDGLGVYQTKQFEMTQFNTSQYAMKTFARVLGDEVLALHESSGRPRWYFMQLDAYCCPHKLRFWALPWSVHCERWTRLVRE